MKPPIFKNLVLRSKDPFAIVSTVISIMAVLILIYAWWFWKAGISSNPERWGQFGDYVGGLLNPIVALAALYLLSWSVRIQRQELQSAQEALHSQADSTKTTVRLNAITIYIGFIDGQIMLKQRELEQQKNTLNLADLRTVLNRPLILEAIDQLNNAISDLEAKKKTYLREVERLLEDKAS